MDYDLQIAGSDAWSVLADNGLGVVVDPLVLRLGQYFLEGARGAGADRDQRWRAITGDIGALVHFFDLIVLHDRLPAFNYHDTFDCRSDFGDRLGAVVNKDDGENRTLWHVDVDHFVYHSVKAAALTQLGERLAAGPFIPQGDANALIETLDAIDYEWRPHLDTLDKVLKGEAERQLARFLLGQLIFAGYAQQTGAPHVLAPQRSKLLLEAGLAGAAPGAPAPAAAATTEAALYEELARRLRDSGPGWRNQALPWTPSFLPYLLKQMNRYREGPATLLRQAKDMRGWRSVGRYRTLRQNLAAADADRSAEAAEELRATADMVADRLDANREELQCFRHVMVELLPRAAAAAGGAVVGGAVAGPAGAAAGGAAGVLGEEVLRQVHARLWGWVVDTLPCLSARKLLARAVKDEKALHDQLAANLRTVWETADTAAAG